MSTTWIDGLWIALGVALLALTAPGTGELLLVTLGALLPRRRRAGAESSVGPPVKLAVVIPAHDEAAGVARCISSLQACEPSPESIASVDIVVVADNCTDDTAARAQGAGARVLRRDDSLDPGKGLALDFAFTTLRPEEHDAYIVVDAGSVVRFDFLRVVAETLRGGAEAVQVPCGVLDADASPRTRLRRVALLAVNRLRPRGRDRLGLSAGLLGNGFALRRRALEAVPYRPRSIVEELEHHLELVRAGLRVAFAERTVVLADMPARGGGVSTPRSRREGGRLRALREVGPGLLLEVLRGRPRLLEPLLDLCRLPLGLHVPLLVLALALPLEWSRLWGAAGLALVALHVLSAIALGGGGLRDRLALGAAPFQLAWQLTLARRTAADSSPEASWAGSAREGSEEESRELSKAP